MIGVGLFSVYMGAVMKKVKMGMRKMGVRFQEGEGEKWRLPGFLYADDLILCFVLEEDLKVMGGSKSLQIRGR